MFLKDLIIFFKCKVLLSSWDFLAITLEFKVFFFFYYFWLCWVFIAARGLSVVVVSRLLIAAASLVLERWL